MDNFALERFVGSSDWTEQTHKRIQQAARYSYPVLIFGPTGTGKKLIARAIHAHSERSSEPLIPFRCGRLPSRLEIQQLFGHATGTSPLARGAALGCLGAAQGGTLLLDEITEMDINLQSKLLRVLQERQVERLGSKKTLDLDVRVLATSNRDLSKAVQDHVFREDLYYRLAVFPISWKPLRERKLDILPLAYHCLMHHSRRAQVPTPSLSESASLKMEQYDWPGNIRELENCVERAMILTEQDVITLESLPRSIRTSDSSAEFVELPDDELSIKRHSRRLEETLIKRALEKTDGNRTHAAKLLEISHRTLLYKLKEYEL